MGHVAELRMSGLWYTGRKGVFDSYLGNVLSVAIGCAISARAKIHELDDGRNSRSGSLTNAVQFARVGTDWNIEQHIIQRTEFKSFPSHLRDSPKVFATRCEQEMFASRLSHCIYTKLQSFLSTVPKYVHIPHKLSSIHGQDCPYFGFHALCSRILTRQSNLRLQQNALGPTAAKDRSNPPRVHQRRRPSHGRPQIDLYVSGSSPASRHLSSRQSSTNLPSSFFLSLSVSLFLLLQLICLCVLANHSRLRLPQMSAQAKINETDQIQQTLNLVHAPQIKTQFLKINEDLAQLTRLIFPDDQGMACELVKEKYRCETQ